MESYRSPAHLESNQITLACLSYALWSNSNETLIIFFYFFIFTAKRWLKKFGRKNASFRILFRFRLIFHTYFLKKLFVTLICYFYAFNRQKKRFSSSLKRYIFSTAFRVHINTQQPSDASLSISIIFVSL